MGTAGERKAAADILAKAKARTGRATLVLDGALVDDHERLVAELAGLDQTGPAARDLADRIVALEAQMAEAEVEFVFNGLGRGRWRKLLADYPPSEQDRATGLDFDPNTFPFAAMTEALEEPAFTAEELRSLLDDVLSEIQFQVLWAACLKANVGSGVSRPESPAAHAITANGRHS